MNIHDIVRKTVGIARNRFDESHNHSVENKRKSLFECNDDCRKDVSRLDKSHSLYTFVVMDKRSDIDNDIDRGDDDDIYEFLNKYD